MTKSINFYASQGELFDKLCNVTAAGEKTYVATNSKNKAKELEALLKERFPAKRVVAVHADNAQQPEVRRMLKDLSTALRDELDILIASPTLGTGIDITYRDAAGAHEVVVQHVFGMFLGNITTHFDCDQALWRVRHPGAVHVWADPTIYEYESDPAAIRDELEHSTAEDVRLVGYTDEGQAFYDDDEALIRIWAAVKSVERGSKNDLAGALRALREANGSVVRNVEPNSHAGKEGSEALWEGRQDRIAREAKAVADADELDWEEYRDMKRRAEQGLPMTDADLEAMRKYVLKEGYAVEDVDAELVVFDADGRTLRGVVNMETMLMSAEEVVAAEKSKMLRDASEQSVEQRVHLRDKTRSSTKLLFLVPAFDLTLLPLRRQLLRRLLTAADLFDPAEDCFKEDAIVAQETLEPFMREMKGSAQDLQRAFELTLRSDSDSKRVSQLNAVLGIVGLELAVAGAKDVGGRKLRFYSLKKDKLKRVQAAVIRREERRIARKADHAQRREGYQSSRPLPELAQKIAEWRARGFVAVKSNAPASLAGTDCALPALVEAGPDNR